MKFMKAGPVYRIHHSVFPFLGRNPCQRRFTICFGIYIMSSSLGATAFVVFGVLSVMTLKELNTQVTEPYMVSHASGASFSVVTSVQSLTRMWVVG